MPEDLKTPAPKPFLAPTVAAPKPPRQVPKTGAGALVGKTITNVNVSSSGSLHTVELGYTGGSFFIKVNQGVFEFGGTKDWGSGEK